MRYQVQCLVCWLTKSLYTYCFSVAQRLNLCYHFFLIGRYLRAVAYREFSRLVYGYLGKRRVPLPACAYTAIRETFPTEEDDLSAGFQLGEFDWKFLTH